MFLPPLNIVCGIPKIYRKMMARIFGGRSVQKGTIPWIAMLTQHNEQPFCGGSLIGKEELEWLRVLGLGAKWRKGT